MSDVLTVREAADAYTVQPWPNWGRWRRMWPAKARSRDTCASAETRHAVFSVRNGKPMSSGNFARRVLIPAGKKVGLPNVHNHAFRHTAASMMDQQGMSTAEKRAVLGHATAAMEQHYTHADGEAMRAKLERVN